MSNFLAQLVVRSLVSQSAKHAQVSSEQIRNKILAETKFRSTKQSPIDQLGIVENNQEDLIQLKYLLGQVLQYPSTQLAKLHTNCYRLGSEDLKESDDTHYNNKNNQKENKQLQYCPCCGYITQSNDLELKTDLNNIKNLGIAPYLYFQMFINLIGMLAVMFIVYSIFSIVTNILTASKLENYQTNTQINSSFILMLSLGSKQIMVGNEHANKFYYIQCWLGLLLMVLWGIGILLMKIRQVQTDQEANRNKHSAAYFSIMLTNIPRNFTLKKLQHEFNKYYRQNQDFDETYEYAHKDKGQLKIAKLNMVKPFSIGKSHFKNDKLEQLNEEYQQMKEQFRQWVKDRMNRKNDQFPLSREQRYKKYQRFYQIKQQIRQTSSKLYRQGLQKLIQKSNQSDQATTAFVTFQDSYSRQFLLNKQNEDFSDKFLYYLSCCNASPRFKLTDSKGNTIKTRIQQAPEPEDVIWENIGYDKNQIKKRKLITFVITLILLGIAFAASFGLSKIKQPNPFTSIILTIFNLLIMKALKILTRKERDHTFSNEQSSLGVKAVLALLINNIVTPIMINYFLQDKNLYGMNGLAYDIFFLGITNTFIPVLAGIIKPVYILHKIYIKWHNKPENRLKLNQLQLNRINERLHFLVGYQYVYMVSLYFFVCFFCSLQPIISVFALIGLCIMYWIQKYNLFHRYKKPGKGGRIVNATMVQVVSFGPFLFALGNLTWTNIFETGKLSITILPNFIAIFIGLIIFIFPYRYIVKKIREEQDKQYENYSENRIYFSSEYDRLNPLTAKDSIKEFKAYFDQHKRQIKNQNLKQIQKMFLHQYSHYQNYMSSLGTFTEQRMNTHQQRVLKHANYRLNGFNPMMVFNILLPDLSKSRKFGTKIQNWKTQTQRNLQKRQKRAKNIHPSILRQNRQHLNHSNPIKMQQSLDYLSFKLFTQRKSELTHENYTNDKRNMIGNPK